MMSNELFDEFLTTMLLMLIKEIIHNEIFNTDVNQVERWRLAYPKAMFYGWISSCIASVYLALINFPAASAGFCAALAWQAMMPPLIRRK